MAKMGPGDMVKDLVLGCVQSWLNRFGREDIIKMISDNFVDREIFAGLKCLCDVLGLDPPKNRFNTKKQIAVKVWAAELYDNMVNEDNLEKLTEIVVSSQELQRVPLALLSGANDVAPVCTRMNTLEKKMEEIVDTVTRFTKGQVLSAVPALAGLQGAPYANAVTGNGLPGFYPPGTPVRTRASSNAGSLAGSFAGAAVAAALKRKHEDASAQARAVAGVTAGLGQVGQQVGGQQPGQVNQPGRA